MVFAILLIPSLLASWFCYWFSSVFPSLSNRTSKIICIAGPFVAAILFAVIEISTSDGSDPDFLIPHYPGVKQGAQFVAIAAVLVIPTLLFAFATARPRGDHQSRKKPQAQ